MRLNGTRVLEVPLSTVITKVRNRKITIRNKLTMALKSHTNHDLFKILSQIASNIDQQSYAFLSCLIRKITYEIGLNYVNMRYPKQDSCIPYQGYGHSNLTMARIHTGQKIMTNHMPVVLTYI